MKYTKGQRVMVNGEAGTVAYQRLDVETFTKALSVSVILDRRKSDYNYNGTIFPAEQVIPIE